MRALLVVTHRYIGLATAIFLALAGLTGSILAFLHEIDERLNPSLYQAPGLGAPLDLATLAQRAGVDHPELDILYIESEGEPGHAALAVGLVKPDPETGEPPPDVDDWVYLDPVTGETLGTRTWGDCCFEPENFIPFIYEFHHTLALPGNWGLYLMGGVALLWTLDCLVALVLTFPRSGPFFRGWGRAWRIKRGGSGFRLAVDLHRAGGLWTWLLLLPIAVSSIAMNLPEEVFKPVVSLFSPVPPNVYYARGAMDPEALGEARVNYRQMLTLGEAEATRLDLPAPTAIYFDAARNYFAVGHGDHDAPLGQAWVFFEGTHGQVIQTMIPGQGTPGAVFTQIQGPIHGGHILGLPGRILVALLGVVICGLSVTGIIIWWRKRAGRVLRARASHAPDAAPSPRTAPSRA